MKWTPAFPDRFVFSWRWQNESKYEKRELVPLYRLLISYYYYSCCRDILGLVCVVSTNTNSYTYVMVRERFSYGLEIKTRKQNK